MKLIFRCFNFLFQGKYSYVFWVQKFNIILQYQGKIFLRKLITRYTLWSCHRVKLKSDIKPLSYYLKNYFYTLFCLLAKLLNSGKIVEINNIEDALCSWHREVHFRWYGVIKIRMILKILNTKHILDYINLYKQQ